MNHCAAAMRRRNVNFESEFSQFFIIDFNWVGVGARSKRANNCIGIFAFKWQPSRCHHLQECCVVVASFLDCCLHPTGMLRARKVITNGNVQFTYTKKTDF